MVQLEDYDHTAKIDDFLEVTEWSNGKGFDLHINHNNLGQFISMTWGEFTALQVLANYRD
jgi:hypothetical protein